jgi:hypothetical protein
MVSKILLGYEEALWPKTLEISHASQILTNQRQIKYEQHKKRMISVFTLIHTLRLFLQVW